MLEKRWLQRGAFAWKLAQFQESTNLLGSE
jgi:hypothetical protein